MLPQNKSLFLKRAAVMLMVFVMAGLQLKAQDVVDATTWNNKIMAGYQGWFREATDPLANDGWRHTFNINTKWPAPGPASLAIDTWPDLSEYGADEKYPVPGFTYPDGKQAYLYSAQNYKTVLRHFEWMKQYGIDGVWLSEFCGHFPGGNQQYDTTFRTSVRNNVRAAATATGRTWAFMWDMSGFNAKMSKADVYNIIVNQWKRMVDQGVATDPRYLHQDGKPVLLIWGFFPNRPASQPDYMNPVIDFLLAPGKYQATIVAGTDNKWRQGTPEFIAMLMRLQGLQPWSVGRQVTDHNTGYKVPYMDEWGDDMKMCAAHNVTFMPVINSGTHGAGPPPVPPKLPQVPRRMGNYLWSQFIKASQTGTISSAFIAMFDEVNEGTQILKITSKPPTQAAFLTYDGATNDYYLRLIGTASRMLKNHEPFTETIPISPFDEKKTYTLKNGASGLTLHYANGAIVQATGKGAEWQLLFDGNGFFTIKNRASGKVLGPGVGNHVSMVPDPKADNVKWHLEWDPTGHCRIINKTTGKTLDTMGKSALVQIEAPVKPDELKTRDDLRWQIIEQ